MILGPERVVGIFFLLGGRLDQSESFHRRLSKDRVCPIQGLLFGLVCQAPQAVEERWPVAPIQQRQQHNLTIGKLLHIIRLRSYWSQREDFQKMRSRFLRWFR